MFIATSYRYFLCLAPPNCWPVSFPEVRPLGEPHVCRSTDYQKDLRVPFISPSFTKVTVVTIL